MKNTLNRPVFFSLLALMAMALSFVPVADAQMRRAKKEKPKNQKKYKHICPAGTEAYGDGPPSGSRVYCRQPVVGGYRPHGTAVKWYSNGHKRQEGEFVRGKRHGVWTAYYRDGRKKTVHTYFDGKKRETIRFDADEQPIKSKAKEERAKKKKAFYWQKIARPKTKRKTKRRRTSWTGKRRGGASVTGW